MKRFYSLAAVALIALAANAQNGAPLYVTGAGDFTNSYWDASTPDQFVYSDGQYTMEVTQLSVFTISTQCGDWETFNEGALTCNYGDVPGIPVALVKGSGNIVCPWKGDYTITVAGDLSTITLSTDSPEPPTLLYLRGDVNGWSTDSTYLMEDIGGGRYSLHVDRLEGAFKFADDTWVKQFGAGAIRVISGNCTVPVVTSQNYAESFNAPLPLNGVDIVLDTAEKTVTFSGLPTDQIVPDIDPDVLEYGCFLYDSDFNKFNDGSLKSNGMYEINIINDGSPIQFYISSAYVNPELSEADHKAAVKRYLYGATAANHEIKNGAQFSLIHPAETLEQASFSANEKGYYFLTLDTNNKILSVEMEEERVYICGNVWSEEGIYNDFLSPNNLNKETYDSQFRLVPLVNQTGVYTGRYRLADAQQASLPQFRFFTALYGWVDTYSLGSAEPDFYTVTVEFSDGSATYPIINHGLSNWGFDAPGQWLTVYVDLIAMEVHFELDYSGIEEIDREEQAGETRWFNLQGIEVDNPEKGIFIKKSAGKCEKVVR